jgi:DHA1 family bicyclomycin/chloramphenicol resistance-like MFS transporter
LTGRIPTHGVGFTILLGALSGLPALAIDMSLPALQGIRRSLHAGATGATLTISLFLAGFAIAQLVLGPLSDRIGRRPVLLGGLTLFTAAGLGCVAAHSIAALILWRLLQGTGAAAATVMALAILRDTFSGETMRQKLSYVATVWPLAPMIAPSIGSAVLLVGGWRDIYATLAGAGLLLLLAALATGESHRPGRLPRGVAGAYLHVLRHRAAGGFCAANALLFGMLFSWVSASPLVLMGAGHVSAPMFGVLFAFTSGGLLLGAWINGRVAGRRIGAERLMLLALAGCAALSLLVLLLTLTALPPVALVPVVAGAMVCRGIAGPNLMHGAMEPLPEMAGVVSAVLGGLQMATGSAVSALVAVLYPALGPPAVGAAMAASAVAALLVGKWASGSYPAIAAVERAEWR